jgi:hypothetical protein
MRRRAGSKWTRKLRRSSGTYWGPMITACQDSSRCSTASIRAWTFFSTAMRPCRGHAPGSSAAPLRRRDSRSDARIDGGRVVWRLAFGDHGYRFNLNHPIGADERGDAHKGAHGWMLGGDVPSTHFANDRHVFRL